MKYTESGQSLRVAGVDGCRAGWVVALVSAAVEWVRVPKRNVSRLGSLPTPRVHLITESIWVSPHIADVLLRTNDCTLVCVDIPIGLSEGPEPRQCDVAARRLLGRRASSVFPPPSRSCLRARSYEEASAAQLNCTGRKLSKQSFLIMDKIRQVDEVITLALQRRVREIHPEVTFCVLNGGRPAQYGKKTLAGRRERIVLLSTLFSNIAEVVGRARRSREVEPDDILDALAAAWTAAKAVIGQAVTLPERPERDREGLRMEILRPVP